jgi:multidrug efflux system membrane fusion protein
MAIRRRSIATAVLALVLVGVAAAWWWMPTRQQQPRLGRNADDGPVPVVAALTRRSDVPVYVDGKLLSVNYTEGQQVERGYLLAQIDPTTYQAAYDQAVAKKALDEATLANARLDLERYNRLAVSNSVPRQQLDTQKMLVAQQEAQVKLDQAQIDNAKAILDYTSIVAPISGRTGIRQVDQGNIVHASDASGVVVITQLQPISVLFTLPQQQLGDVNRAFARGALPVDAFGPDNKTVVETGELKVVDNQVDPSTGTIKLKAEFPNREMQLWPGGFINVRLLTHTLKQVIVAPTAAVQRGPAGTFVYVVQPDSKVAVRPVTVAQQDEVQAVIANGLEPDERVVTTGFARLAAGAQVAVSNAESPPSPDAAPQPQRQRRRGGAQGQQRSEAATSTRQ